MIFDVDILGDILLLLPKPFIWRLFIPPLFLKIIDDVDFISMQHYKEKNFHKFDGNKFLNFYTLSCNLERVRLLTAADSLARRICPGDDGATSWSILGKELTTILFLSFRPLFWLFKLSLFWAERAVLFFKE